ncbi:hypothetical protein F220043C3_44390 [Enterocloster asparagiformis]
MIRRNGAQAARAPHCGQQKTADKTLSAAFDPTLFDDLNGNTNKALKSVNSGLNSPASQKISQSGRAPHNVLSD